MQYYLDFYPTAELNDKCQDEKIEDYSFLRLNLVDFGRKTHFAGKARTLITLEDTLLAKKIYQQPGEGAVLVVDGCGSLRTALLGDMNAAILAENGWAGIIVNGAVRDTEILKTLDIGIKALARTPVNSAKKSIGEIDVPLGFGEVLIQPGDCIYADADGVLISKQPLSF